MAARKSKLGPDFWGNFYRLDTDKYTEQAFREELLNPECGRADNAGVQRYHGQEPQRFPIDLEEEGEAGPSSPVPSLPPTPQSWAGC